MNAKLFMSAVGAVSDDTIAKYSGLSPAAGDGKRVKNTDRPKRIIKWLAAAAALIALGFGVFALIRSFAGIESGRPHGGDYPAAIMVNGTLYYSTDEALPVEINESAIRYTTSYAEDGVPRSDGEANFNRDTGTPYAVIDSRTVVVLIDNEWIAFRP